MIININKTHAQNIFEEIIDIKRQSLFLNSAYDVHGDTYGDYYDVPYGDYYDTSSEDPH